MRKELTPYEREAVAAFLRRRWERDEIEKILRLPPGSTGFLKRAKRKGEIGHEDHSHR